MYQLPLLSIVIPTKDRYQTLLPLLYYLLSWKDENVEIIIQDNSSNPFEKETLLTLAKVNSNLVYNYCSESISAIDNCDRAISNSTGEYICFIGDDDGIIKYSMAIVKWMKEQNIDSMTCKHANYFWPDYRLLGKSKLQSMASVLSYVNDSGRIEFVNPRESLIYLLKEGALIMSKIPRVYHGIIKKTMMDAVKKKTGSYFPGPVPDMSSSVALSLVVNRHIYIDYPVIVAGASRNSMAGRGGLGNAHGDLNKEESLPIDSIQYWSDLIPKYWAPNTIWPEGALQAIVRMDASDYLKYMDYNKVYFSLYLDLPIYRDKLLIFLRQIDENFNQNSFEEKVNKFKTSRWKNAVKQFIKVNSVILYLNNVFNIKVIRGGDINVVLKKLDVLVDKDTESFKDIFTLNK